MAELIDRKERELIRTALDRNMIVEAAAGTGKTSELVNRIIAVLESGEASVDRIVAVTFTEKAAGELKLRMRQRIELARQQANSDSDEHRHLEVALARLEEARVGTIHGFCADLLRERSVEAEVDPQFEMLTEPESERLYRDAFNLWLQEKLEKPPAGVRRSLRRRSYSQRGAGSGIDDGPVSRLRRAGWTLAEWRDFPEPWRRMPFDRERRVDALVEQLHTFAALSAKCSKPNTDKFFSDTEQARLLSEELRTAEAVRPRDYDGVEAELVELAANRDFGRARRGYGNRYGDGVTRDEVVGAHETFLGDVQLFAQDADSDLAALLHVELFETIERYERLKQRTGRLDFVDLLLRARNLIRDRESVRADFQKRLTHIFVDEFQDTDPLQAEILLLLAAHNPAVNDWRKVEPAAGKLFIVADPKQSIYRFRRADIGIYHEVKELLLGRDALLVQLTTSFRGVPSIQRAVNTAFAPAMTGDVDAQQASYVPLAASREDPRDQPAVVALPVPEPYGYRAPTKRAIENSLPDAVAAFVQWILEKSTWKVSEREHPDKRVPVTARHICLLFRRFDSFFAGDVTRGYVQALEARDIRHLLVGGRSFHEREEVDTIRTALSAIEWPDDELSVFATLRGSLFAVGDEELLEYRHNYVRLHPFRKPKEELPEELAPITHALDLLASLHRERNRRPIAETINLLLESTRAHAGFVFRPSGEQVLANVLHVAELARGYESSGGISFRGFVERLQEDAESGKTAQAPILEEGSDGVRIMTVHRAKGLEFPVVILADMTANLSPTSANRYIDAEKRLSAMRIAGWSPRELLEHQEIELAREQAEGIRIAYVAATRARDLLVVPAIGDAPWGQPATRQSSSSSGDEAHPTAQPRAAAKRPTSPGWISSLNAAIYPPRERWSEAQPAPGCPLFGNDSVLSRPSSMAFDSECVVPGLHLLSGPSPEATPSFPPTLSLVGTDTSKQDSEGQYGVVWWDPSSLDLKARPLFGIRQETILAKDAEPAVVQEDEQRFLDWQKKHNSTLARASQPGLQVQTATERAAFLAQRAAASEYVAAAEVELLELPFDKKRPAGPRFGALVHAILATIPLSADRASIDQTAELQGRILGAKTEELTASKAAVENVLKHPLMQRAREADHLGRCRRESPITLREKDGSLIDGVVDLTFLENDTWIVVDFKTDREIAADSLLVYKSQVALYARAIAAATGKKTSGLLMRI